MRLLLLGILLGVGQLLTAQPYGHLNFAILISEMPGTERAETDLKAYNDSLTVRGEAMVTRLRERIAEVEAQRDELAPVRRRELQAELTAQRDSIGRYERQMGVAIERRRQELLGPIIQEARAAVQAVAEENGYVLIFDTSNFNTVLYGRDSDDIMPLVRAKLGMQ